MYNRNFEDAMIYHDCIAGVTTYNPCIERLKSNISSIAEQVDKVVVVDNGSKNKQEIESILKNYKNVVFIDNKSNRGIAYAMNRIGNYAFENSYNWFITLDQDSICPKDMLDLYQRNTDEKIAIVVPNVVLNKHFISEFLHIKSKTKENLEPHCVLYGISSGQMIRTSVWKKMEGFWNYLFIDYVDQEFCFHVTREGYKIIRIPTVKLDHEPGIALKVLGIPTAKQSAMREYYWSRNSRLIYWLYKEQYKNAIGRPPIVLTLKRIANSILVRESVIDKLKAIFYGIIDAYEWKSKYEKKGRFPTEITQRRY